MNIYENGQILESVFWYENDNYMFRWN